MSVNCSEHAVQVLVQCTRDGFHPVSCQIRTKIKTRFFVIVNFFYFINTLAKKKKNEKLQIPTWVFLDSY